MSRSGRWGWCRGAGRRGLETLADVKTETECPPRDAPPDWSVLSVQGNDSLRCQILLEGIFKNQEKICAHSTTEGDSTEVAGRFNRPMIKN